MDRSRRNRTMAVVDDVATEAATRLLRRLHDLQAAGRTPRVALTGGTIATRAYRLLPELSGRSDGEHVVDWASVEFWWGDERWLPAGHAERNDQQAREAFLDELAVPAGRIHAFGSDDGSATAVEAAAAYAAILPAGGFDLVLLGLGPDGHVASLFPDRPAVEETERSVVAVRDSPKPPPERLTLTVGSLNNAHAVWFLVTGAEKAEAVARAVASHPTVPAAQVAGRDETLWLLDEAAAPPRTQSG